MARHFGEDDVVLSPGQGLKAFVHYMDGVLADKGILKKDLAAQLGIKVDRVYSSLNGNAYPSPMLVRRIVELLDIDPIKTACILGYIPDKYKDETVVVSAAHEAAARLESILSETKEIEKSAKLALKRLKK